MEGLYTFKQFIEQQNLFTESSVRNMIFNRHKNGLEESGAIKRYGRKILIDKEKFHSWINLLSSKDYPQKP